MTITPEQCRAARALAQIDVATLAQEAEQPAELIKAYEAGSELEEASIAAICAALEELGVVFIPENGDGGLGVRLKFSRRATRQISTWETEGGLPADDDVP